MLEALTVEPGMSNLGNDGSKHVSMSTTTCIMKNPVRATQVDRPLKGSLSPFKKTVYLAKLPKIENSTKRVAKNRELWYIKVKF